MARPRRFVHTIHPTNGPAVGVTAIYAEASPARVGAIVTVATRPMPLAVQTHEYRITEIVPHQVTGTDTQLRAEFVRSLPPAPAPAPRSPWAGAHSTSWYMRASPIG